jgi:hypothetical protein
MVKLGTVMDIVVAWFKFFALLYIIFISYKIGGLLSGMLMAFIIGLFTIKD